MKRGIAIIVTVASICGSLSAVAQSPGDSTQNPDDSLKIYGLKIVKTTPFQEPTAGYGIYLGRGFVLTAAHVIGRWGFLKNPHVLVAGQSLPAKMIKEGGGSGQVDLTLLSVDETRLPVSMRLRRNPLCKQPPFVNEDVIVVTPDQTSHFKIVSPALVHPVYRVRYFTLINEAAGSGSGVFDANRKCLLGIVSARVEKINQTGRTNANPSASLEYVGYFVSAALIEKFIPAEIRF